MPATHHIGPATNRMIQPLIAPVVMQTTRPHPRPLKEAAMSAFADDKGRDGGSSALGGNDNHRHTRSRRVSAAPSTTPACMSYIADEACATAWSVLARMRYFIS